MGLGHHISAGPALRRPGCLLPGVLAANENKAWKSPYCLDSMEDTKENNGEGGRLSGTNLRILGHYPNAIFRLQLHIEYCDKDC